MIAISTPDAKQSESYIATTALFLIFGSSVREEKVFLRLPATWRELWTEFAEMKTVEQWLADNPFNSSVADDEYAKWMSK